MHLDTRVVFAFIIGAVCGGGLFTFMSVVPSENKMRASMRQVEKAYRRYYDQSHCLTERLEDLREFSRYVASPEDFSRWGKDVWGNTFLIETNSFPMISIVSLGPRHWNDISYRMSYSFVLEEQ